MTDSDADAIAEALSLLRGRRPRPPWADAGGRDPQAHPGFGPHGGPRGHGMGPHAGGLHGGMRGMGPQARFAGPARLRLLEALAAADGSLTVSALAEAVGVDQPRASRLVQQCVELGLVRREADPDDARRTRIALTDEGSRLARGFRGQRREAVEAALAGFTAAEREELARLLTKFAQAWPDR
ncbi:MarR family winged helix-turn-helix transcriptional regulator [Microbacterium fluvii]|uniref:MarR family winged helix-turn-helix transcriptional regulator n=1 Tax=Microbacterium fluvii TaxID=415215 RepID=A0ABW2HCX4_9MICO|nr:MarR family winged helix-turn-helix transcriptional regulator [Microbacterium fluvii]MCU4672824.1 MarR family winged helix-turn-helix transcriptional regulator [Microbacterium fluvii]